MSVEIPTISSESVENCIDCPNHSECTATCYVLERDVKEAGIDEDCPYLVKVK